MNRETIKNLMGGRYIDYARQRRDSTLEELRHLYPQADSYEPRYLAEQHIGAADLPRADA